MHSVFFTIVDKNGNVSVTAMGPFKTIDLASRAAEQVVGLNLNHGEIGKYDWNTIPHTDN